MENIVDYDNFQTPQHVCDYMVGVLKSYPSSGTWRTILEPTPGRGNIVNVLKFFPEWKVVIPDKDFWEPVIQNNKYDAIIGNPPFTPMKIAYEILFRCMEMSDIVIMIVPWLTLINSDKRIKYIMEYGLRSGIHLPRSTFKGARIQSCILNLDKHYYGRTDFTYIN